VVQRKARSVVALVLAGLILGFLAWSFITPDHILLEESVVLNKSKDQVFTSIQSLKSQSKLWNQEAAQPPIYKGVDSEVGAEMFIESADGHIRQKITKIVDGERVESELWISYMTGTNVSFIQLDSLSEDSTEIVWGIIGTHNFPTDVLARLSGADNKLRLIMKKGLERFRMNEVQREG